jgi:hypothetical protein
VVERLDPRDVASGRPKFLQRVEVLDRKSGTHLGHVFDGERPSLHRYARGPSYMGDASVCRLRGGAGASRPVGAASMTVACVPYPWLMLGLVVMLLQTVLVLPGSGTASTRRRWPSCPRPTSPSTRRSSSSYRPWTSSRARRPTSYRLRRRRKRRVQSLIVGSAIGSPTARQRASFDRLLDAETPTLRPAVRTCHGPFDVFWLGAWPAVAQT